MFYFVPSWYSENRVFYDVTVPWYWYNSKMMLDDITSLFKLFCDAEENSSLLIVGYMPNLRYYLHEFDLYEQSYVSIFDRLQDIKNVTPKIIHFQDLEWPKSAEFVYTPFLVMVYLKGELFAELHFGNDGQFIWVDYFEKNVLARRFVLDDRGFLSSILYFDDEGRESYQEFLNVNGVWQFRQYLSSERSDVVINPQVSKRFKRPSYASLEQLIEEFVSLFFTNEVTDRDTVVLSYEDRHNTLITNHLDNQELIVSFFSGRRNSVNSLEKTVLKRAQLILTDTVSEYRELKSMNIAPVASISPYDARFSLGKSQRIKELIIYMLVDQLSLEELDEIVDTTFDVMMENQNIDLVLASYRLDEPFKSEIERFFLRKDEEWRVRNGQVVQDSFDVLYQKELENVGSTSMEDKNYSPRLNLKFLVNEEQLIQQLDKARLIVDLSTSPDLYTQIAGISAGVPQVNRIETDYVEALKNGYIVQNMDDLKRAYAFYLLTLRNWNEALVYSVSKISEYTGGAVVNKILSMIRKTNHGK